MLVGFTRVQDAGREIGVVGRVGKPFSFKTEARTVHEGLGKEISCVELDSGLVG